jgi:AAA domain
MSLITQITTGIKPRPHFIGLYGPGGVGKSTFAATAPAAVFLGTDDGVATMDVASFPAPKTWQDVKAAVSDLLIEKHDFETLVIDTINGLEPLVWAHVCKEAQCKSIEEVDGGFGKGYVRAEEEWVEFFKSLKRLRMKMNVIVLGHSKIKSTEDPYENERYDRHLLKMDQRGAALLHESVDCMFFANFKTTSSKEKGAKKAKMSGDGRRRMFTEERPAFLAKSRFDLPFEMELSWDAFIEAVAKCIPTAKATEDKLLTLFKGNEIQATAYLVNIGWLEAGQELKDLLAAKRKPILSRPGDFLKAVEKFSTKKNEPEEDETSTTNEEN